MTERIDTGQLQRLRLASQLIEGDVGALSVAAVVHRLLAMQAQDFGQALWAVGLRSPGTTRTDVLAALDRGDIVRSWPMRGTLFFTRAADLRWMLALTAERTLASFASRRRQLELDQATLDKARDVAEQLLPGKRHLGRADILHAFDDAGISTAGQRGYHIIWYLAQSGVVCWGPTHRTQQALVLLDEWVPEASRLQRDEALGEFVHRYFAGHGPATLKDFAWWSKLTIADSKRGLAAARDRLTEVEYDGGSYWIASSAVEGLDGGEGTAGGRTLAGEDGLHLLPGFDEYIIGYQDRTPVLAPEHAHQVVPGKNGIFRPTIISAGQAIGTWRRAKPGAGGHGAVPEPFEQGSAKQQKAFGQAALRYDQFRNGAG